MATEAVRRARRCTVGGYIGQWSKNIQNNDIGGAKKKVFTGGMGQNQETLGRPGRSVGLDPQPVDLGPGRKR